MQGIRDKGDADWRSTDVGAVVGVFEVPIDMPCYEAPQLPVEASPLATQYVI